MTPRRTGFPGAFNFANPATTHCKRGHAIREPGAIYEDCYGRRLCAVCRQTRDRKRRLAEQRRGEVLV